MWKIHASVSKVSVNRSCANGVSVIF